MSEPKSSGNSPSASMPILRVRLFICAGADLSNPKTTIFLIRSIQKEGNEEIYVFPPEHQPLCVQTELNKLPAVIGVTKSLKSRGQFRRITVTFHGNLMNTYFDEDENRRFMGEYLEETYEQNYSSNADTSSLTQKKQSLNSITKDAVILKFNGTTPSPKTWLSNLERAKFIILQSSNSKGMKLVNMVMANNTAQTSFETNKISCTDNDVDDPTYKKETMKGKDKVLDSLSENSENEKFSHSLHLPHCKYDNVQEQMKNLEENSEKFSDQSSTLSSVIPYIPPLILSDKEVLPIDIQFDKSTPAAKQSSETCNDSNLEFGSTAVHISPLIKLNENDEKNEKSDQTIPKNMETTRINNKSTHELLVTKCNINKKRTVCKFCKLNVTNFERHLVRHHREEKEIKDYQNFTKNTKEGKQMRRNILALLRYEEIFDAYVKKDELDTNKLPCSHYSILAESDNSDNDEEPITCTNKNLLNNNKNKTVSEQDENLFHLIRTEIEIKHTRHNFVPYLPPDMMPNVGGNDERYLYEYASPKPSTRNKEIESRHFRELVREKTNRGNSQPRIR
ncbi:hypothetical protein PGB90_004972 [Kerria lacca]